MQKIRGPNGGVCLQLSRATPAELAVLEQAEREAEFDNVRAAAGSYSHASATCHRLCSIIASCMLLYIPRDANAFVCLAVV